ncbi:MAG: hypothetical protein J6R46_04675, partial [Clostridia bacterium]|nr:hypothetical protein [Clostridia bacterium]
MQYPVESKNIKLVYDPQAIALEVHVEDSGVVWSWAEGGKLRLGDGTVLPFLAGECQSRACKRGRIEGVQATYTSLRDEKGNAYPFTVDTFVGIDQNTDQLRVQATVTGDAPGNVAALEFPPRMKFEVKEGHGYTVLPRMQGTLVPAGHPIQIINGYIFERDGYMPLYGQVQDGCGYAAIFATPYDARYALAGEEVQPYFIPSLGTMSYMREMVFAFFPKGDFNTIAKIYRAYRAERGHLVSLRENIARNPKVEYL